MSYSYPEIWLKDAIQTAAGIAAHPSWLRRCRDAFCDISAESHRKALGFKPINGKYSYRNHGRNDCFAILHAR